MEFATVLCRLRQERGLSQRRAAADLNISQALLSHYEKGIREPRLEFVIRACEYYGVSADYMLGRTDSKENPAACAPNSGVWDSERFRNLVAAANVLVSICASVSGGALTEPITDFLGYPVYKLLRLLELAGQEEAAPDGGLAAGAFLARCDGAAREAEALVFDALTRLQDRTGISGAEAELAAAAPAMHRAMQDFIAAYNAYFTPER